MEKIGILWDLDGTLLDTLEGLKNATNAALASLGYPERSLEEVRRFVGNGAGVLMTRAVPENGDAEKALAAFQTYYQAHCREKTAPYPGILAALKEIGKKYPMAIVSNKPDGAVKTLCADYFPGIFARGESEDCPRKPAPNMVYKAMAAIGCEKCIYVGDSEVDVLTAKNAQAPCLSVLWGFRDKAEIQEAGGRYFCTEPAELLNMIERIAEEIYGE